MAHFVDDLHHRERRRMAVHTRLHLPRQYKVNELRNLIIILVVARRNTQLFGFGPCTSARHGRSARIEAHVGRGLDAVDKDISMLTLDLRRKQRVAILEYNTVAFMPS